jgi:hypothetical protein
VSSEPDNSIAIETIYATIEIKCQCYCTLEDKICKSQIGKENNRAVVRSNAKELLWLMGLDDKDDCDSTLEKTAFKEKIG